MPHHVGYDDGDAISSQLDIVEVIPTDLIGCLIVLIEVVSGGIRGRLGQEGLLDLFG